MSLEFSGQITMSGCLAVPAATRCASASVARTWLSSTASRCALNSSPSRGTLPCTIATWTGRPIGRAGRHGQTQNEEHGCAAEHEHHPGTRSRPHRRRLDDQRASRAEREQPAGHRDHEGDQRRAAEHRVPQHRRIRLAEREPPPREPAERRSVAQRLLTDPERAGDQRPRPAVPVDEHARVRRRAAEQPRGTAPPDGQQQPRHRSADDVRPLQQRHVERESGEPGEPESAPEPAPVDRDGDQRHADRCQPPDVVGREREQQRPAAEQSRDHGDERGQLPGGVGWPWHRCRCRGHSRRRLLGGRLRIAGRRRGRFRGRHRTLDGGHDSITRPLCRIRVSSRRPPTVVVRGISACKSGYRAHVTPKVTGILSQHSQTRPGRVHDPADSAGRCAVSRPALYR